MEDLVKMDKKFWNNRKVLITGFEGFLGSRLSKALLKTKAKVIGLDIKTHRRETVLRGDDYKKMALYKGSVTDYNLLRKILRKHSVNVIFHLAAEAIVGRGQRNPRRTFKANIAGTWTVLEAARQHGKIEAVIIASSDKAYGSHEKLPYREDMPLIAKHPYDVSKSCADLIAHAYAHTYGLPVAITRCGNVYGPGDFHFSRIIPDAIRCALTGKTLLIRSDGTYLRDYVYVDDIINGYISLAERLPRSKISGEAFNFSDESPLTVLNVVERIARATGGVLRYKILDNAKYEIKNQYLKSRKSRDVLEWRPRYTFTRGISETINWFKTASIAGYLK